MKYNIVIKILILVDATLLFCKNIVLKLIHIILILYGYKISILTKCSTNIFKNQLCSNFDRNIFYVYEKIKFQSKSIKKI